MLKSILFIFALLATIQARAVSGPVTPGSIAPSEPQVMSGARGDGEIKGSLKMAKVHFSQPKDGATVKPTFHVKFVVEGLKVAPAGEILPGTGHFHVIVDEGPTPEGVVVPSDDKHIHYGKGQTEADLKLTPGSHKLTLQFADGAHRSYGPALSQTVTVKVQ